VCLAGGIQKLVLIIILNTGPKLNYLVMKYTAALILEWFLTGNIYQSPYIYYLIHEYREMGFSFLGRLNEIN
jgi:hypothetical protein